MSGVSYVSFMQEVLFYGSETWFMSPHIGRTLVGFHHNVYRILIRHQHRKGMYGMWVQPLMAEVMEEVGLHEVETYVSFLQNKVSQYTVTRTIMDLCLLAVIRPGTRVSKRWWDQEGLYLEGKQMEAHEEEQHER